MEHVSNLSKRLQMIAKEVPNGGVLADIGTDHAQLPEALIRDGIIKRAIASDINAGPFQTALRNVGSAGLSDSISVRLGSGLTTLEITDRVDTVSVAGMGGGLIREILQSGKEMLLSVDTLILQANVAADLVRRWLYDEGWHLTKEAIVKEGEHFYEIMVASRSQEGNDYRDNDVAREDEFLFGPLLMNEGSEAFILKWSYEYEHLKRVREQIAIANHRDKGTSEAYARIDDKLTKIKEVLENVKKSSERKADH